MTIDEQATMRLITDLRAWLRAQHLAPQVQAGALVYELAAVIAREADSVPQAHALLEFWLQIMKAQIAHFGVGRAHP